jgi:hypothetical protein
MIRTLALFAGAAFATKYWLDRRDAAPSGDRADDSPLPDAISAQDDPGHVAVDLLTDAHPDGTARADDHFRPDPTAPVAAEDRESLRPVTAPAPHDPPGR